MSAVLFDLDGTLIDSLGDIAGALNFVLAEAGLPSHSRTAFQALIGEGASELVRRAIPPERRDAMHAPLLERYKARYRAHMLDVTRPYDGIEELLERLEERGIPKAVVTNKPHGPAAEIVGALLGRFRWGAIVGQVDGVPMKPDPAMALSAASTLGVAAGECFFVGDSGVDMQTAAAAEMVAVGCAWGLRNREELERGGARHLIAHPRELLEIVVGR